ncbi:MAG: Uma2 family endonuclease [Leptolyngbya sp. SIO4C1]|nr:Uma2 family endonuclease [Leptolyngbya sp. SIO4C1]
MAQAASSALTFDQFLTLYPEDGGRYELRHGAMVEMRPIGPHEQVIALLRRKLDVEIERLNLPYFIPQSCLVKPQRGGEGYLPDIVVLDQAAVKDDPYWQKRSSISLGRSAKLMVEVVSTNWQDDYLTKLAEYEKLGVAEYWIADYRALGGIRYIGQPKTPTVWVYQLSGEEYQAAQSFRGTDKIVSSVFPELSLAVNQIVAAGET